MLSVSGTLNNEALEQIYAMTNLLQLSLRHHNVLRVAKCHTIKLCSTGLKALNLGRSGSDAWLHAAASCCPELIGFSLSGSERVTANGILDIVSNCKNLTKILIVSSDKVNDGLVQKLVVLNDKLESVTLSDCKCITDLELSHSPASATNSKKSTFQSTPASQMPRFSR